MSANQLDFCLIPKKEMRPLCREFELTQRILYSDYHSQPLITIDKYCLPASCGDVLGDGNCLYRAVCLSISGSEVSFEQIKQLTADSLKEHRRDFAKIDEEHINDLT